MSGQKTKKRDWRKSEAMHTITRPLTEGEISTLKDEMRISLNEIRRRESDVAHFKDLAKNAQKVVDTETVKFRAVADDLLLGTTTDQVMCKIVLDYDTGLVHYFHPATGEEVHTRPMTEKELQREFAFEGPTKPGEETVEGEVEDDGIPYVEFKALPALPAPDDFQPNRGL